MSPRLKNFPRQRARALGYLFLTLAFVFAAPRAAGAAGTFVSAPSRVDMVYDSARDTLYITSGGSVLRYQLGTGSFLSPFNLGGSLAGLDLSPDGNTLVVADRTRNASNTWVHVVNLNTGASSKVLFPRYSLEGGTFTVAYTGDNQVLITSTFEGSGWVPLRRLNPATGVWTDLRGRFTSGFGEVRQDTMLAASGDRSVVGFAESNASDGPVGRYRVSDSTVVQKTGYTDGTSWFNYEIGANKNGTQFAVPTYGGTFIYNGSMVKTGTVLGVYAGAQPIGVVYHPVEDLVYFPWTTTMEVRAFNTSTFAQVAAYNFEDTFKSNGNWAFQQGRMKMSRDGSLLFATVTGGVRFVRLYAPLAAADQSVTTAENTPVAVTLSGSVGNGGALSYRVATQPAHGTLSGTGAELTYTPEPNYEGADSFTFKSVYGPAESAAATVNVTVTPGNNAPTADDQSVTADEDGSVAVTLTGTDPEGSAVTFAVTSGPAYGTLSGTAPDLVYTPAPNFYGSDTFAFSASDGAASNTGHVYVTVNGVNDAPSVIGQSLATDEDAPLAVKLKGEDIDSGSLSFMVFAPPQHGTLSGTMPDLVYTPAPNYNGPDSFGFKANDGAADSNDATVKINVRSVNDAPTANNQAVTTDEDTPASVVLTGSDADGDAVSYTLSAPPVKGTLSGTAPDFVYTPPANYSGPDVFSFKVSDGTATSSLATVSITVRPVNDAPTALSQSLGTNEDRPLSFRLYGYDAENDPVTYEILSQPTHGSLSGPATALVYSPEPNFSGTDGFTFKVNDGRADSAVATISLKIDPVNDAPVATPLTINVDEDASAPATLAATDLEDNQFGFEIVNYPQHGALSGTIPNLSYKASANYNGPDSFNYRAYDGKGWSEIVTATINVAPVNDAPAASPQTVAASEDSAAQVVLSGSDVDGDAVSFANITAPAHGTLSGTAPNLVYTPAPNYNGPDSFAFRTSDGSSLSAPATVTINVAPVNDTPTATALSLPANEDTARAVNLTGYDLDNNPLTYSVVTQPAYGTLSGTAPNLVYTPAPNYNGPDSFTFKVNDGYVDSAPAAVQINVAPVNDAPVPNQQTVNATEDTAVNVTLTATDVDGDQLGYFLVNPPQHGGFVGGVIPNLVYKANPNYSGPDSFTFYVNDGKSQSAPVTVTINVAAVNDAPVAFGDAGSVVRNSSVSLSVVANDADADGDNLIVVSVSQPPNGSVSIAAGGKSVTYTPRRNYRGNDAFTYTVSDGRGGTASASVNVTVK